MALDRGVWKEALWKKGGEEGGRTPEEKGVRGDQSHFLQRMHVSRLCSLERNMSACGACKTLELPKSGVDPRRWRIGRHVEENQEVWRNNTPEKTKRRFGRTPEELRAEEDLGRPLVRTSVTISCIPEHKNFREKWVR
jgi:hypothetical protein